MRKIRKDDLVKIITGKDKDKQGKVLRVDTKTGKILVEGCNMVTKHSKPSAAMPQGGIVSKPQLTFPTLCWLLMETQPV